MAQDVGPRAVGIILSGTGSDGSRGIRAIHEAGGLVIAQSEATAKFVSAGYAAVSMQQIADAAGVTKATL